jgi:hypothetical protein
LKNRNDLQDDTRKTLPKPVNLQMKVALWPIKRNTISYTIWVSVMNNFAKESNNIRKYTALTDSAI